MANADPIMGMMWGVAIGDALGAPFEFRQAKPKLTYTGIVADVPVEVKFRFATMHIPPASITDDTEMTIQLLDSIFVEGGGHYKEENAIKAYLQWANLKGTPLGKNTRKLMKGVKTVKGFRARQALMEEWSQSNGSLMRCSPLALLPEEEWQAASDADVNLTNNNKVNRECSRIYLTILRSIIYDTPIKLKCSHPQIVKVLKSALRGEILDVSQKETKGWVVNALYVAVITLFNSVSYQSGMDYIAKHFMRGDTDTLMAIAGGLLGALYGYSAMKDEPHTALSLEKVKRYMHSSDRPSFTPIAIVRIVKVMRARDTKTKIEEED